jgi:hypothetical protein
MKHEAGESEVVESGKGLGKSLIVAREGECQIFCV